MSLPGIPGIIVLPRDLSPRQPMPSSCWSSSFVHWNNCPCARCAHFGVNGHAPKEAKP